MAFQKVTLEWGGVQYVIPPEKVMMAIALVEDVVTLNELSRYSLSGNPKVSKLAKAYTELLQFAGCQDVTWEDMYSHMFVKDATGTSEAMKALLGLLQMMVPPRHIPLEEGSPSKKDHGSRASSSPPTSSPADRSNSGDGGSATEPSGN